MKLAWNGQGEDRKVQSGLIQNQNETKVKVRAPYRLFKPCVHLKCQRFNQDMHASLSPCTVKHLGSPPRKNHREESSEPESVNDNKKICLPGRTIYSVLCINQSSTVIIQTIKSATHSDQRNMKRPQSHVDHTPEF